MAKQMSEATKAAHLRKLQDAVAAKAAQDAAKAGSEYVLPAEVATAAKAVGETGEKGVSAVTMLAAVCGKNGIKSTDVVSVKGGDKTIRLALRDAVNAGFSAPVRFLIAMSSKDAKESGKDAARAIAVRAHCAYLARLVKALEAAEGVVKVKVPELTGAAKVLKLLKDALDVRTADGFELPTGWEASRVKAFDKNLQDAIANLAFALEA